MGDHCALSVGSTGSRCVAHVFATVENAGLLVRALVVTATTNLAALLVADFSGEAFLVGGAGKETASVEALLINSTVFVGKAGWAALSSVTNHAGWTVGFRLADSWYTDASSSGVFGVTGKTFWTSAHSVSVDDAAEGVRSASVLSFTRIKAHQQTMFICFADGTGWTVGVAIWTFVWSSTTRLTVGRTDVSFGWTVALVAGNFVDAQCRPVADLLCTKVHSFTSGQWVTFKAFQTATNGRVLFRTAVGVFTANGLAGAVHLSSTGIDALVVGAHLIGIALIVGCTLDRSTSEAFIIGIAKVAGKTLTNGLMSEHLANGISPANDSLTGVLAVVETSEISSTCETISALVVIVASIFNTGYTKSLETGVVGRAVGVEGAGRQTLSVFTLFIDITVSGTSASAATVVIHEAKFRRRTAFIVFTWEAFSTTCNWVTKEAFFALARVTVSLRYAESVVTTCSGRQADVNALVVIANVSFLDAVVAGSALHLLASHEGVTVKVLWTATLRSMVGGDTGGVHSANGRIVAAVSTLRSACYLNTSRGVWTFSVTVVADVRFVAAWLFISIAH